MPVIYASRCILFMYLNQKNLSNFFRH
jgi:hypothetical protein